MKKFMKKLLLFTVIATMIVTAMPLTGIDLGDIFTVAEAAETHISGDYEYMVFVNNNGENTAWISKYNGSEKNLVIPEKIDGNIVDNIGSNAFEGSQTLESVVLPDTVVAIYDYAFKNCQNLKSVKFPDTPVALDEYCFYGCKSLTEVTINLDLSCDYVWDVGKGVFEESGVKKITLIGDFTIFPAEMLDGSAVEEIEIPESVTKIDSKAFKYSMCETVIVKGVLKAAEMGNWARNATENGQIDRIIYHQPPARSGSENWYFSRYDVESGYWISEYCDFYIGCDPDEVVLVDEGDFRFGIMPNGDAHLWEYWGDDTEVYIPSQTAEGHPVVSIFDQTFRGKKNIKKVVIPSSVRAIGFEAFRACYALEEIVIPDTVEYIGDDAFEHCTSLKSIDYPPLEFIPVGVFANCTALTEFVIPETVKAIGSYAFGSCTSLSSVTLNEGLKQIGYSAFSKSYIGGNGYPAITELDLPESLEYIGDYAFRCSSLDKIEIPAKVKEIKSYAFSESEISELTLNEGLEIIGDCAFSNCRNLQTVDFPDSVKSIGKNAFECCENIYRVEFNPNLTAIGNFAFAGIDALESIVIPSSVKTIGNAAFKNSYLKNITIENGVEEIDDYAFYSCSAKELTIPESVKALGKYVIDNSAIETLYYNAINANPEMLNNEFRDLKPIFNSVGLKRIVFGENVKNVPAHFAYNNAQLEEIIFSDSVESIVWRAFYGCTSLKTLDLPQSLKLLDYAAFYGCKALTEITLPEGLQTLDSCAFEKCSGLKTINFNSANCKFTRLEETETEGLYYSPFIGLENLETINLGENVKELPAYLFSGIQTIGEVALSSTVTDIGVGAFAFSSVTSLKASDNIESIEESAFYGCENLESADFGSGIMLIGANAFTDCDKLTEVYIPDTVTNIETEAFKNCTALHTVRMSSYVDYIPREAFYNCTALTTFTWDSDSKLVGRLAFGNCVKLVDFDFVNVEKLYVNSFLGSGVNVVQLGESENEASRTPLTTIEVQSFMSCENLETLGIGGNVTTIKTQAFADCSNLETAIIADSVTEIADDAFDGCNKLTIYCSENSYAHSYAQEQGIRVSTLVIAPIPNQTYTGFEIKPEISVSASGDTLDKNIDFSVSYANNVNVGNADVTVKGKGDFRMFASKANFTIVTKSISAVTVAPVADQPYTGSVVTPEITVTDGIIILREGTDYTVTYSNNVDEGTATVNITGKGNYSGFSTTSFIISKDAEEPSFFDNLITAMENFFARIISFFAWMFM